MVNARLFEPGTEPYVLPSHCEHVFYSKVPGRGGWSFVVRHDPRGRPVSIMWRMIMKMVLKKNMMLRMINMSQNIIFHRKRMKN